MRQKTSLMPPCKKPCIVTPKQNTQVEETHNNTCQDFVFLKMRKTFQTRSYIFLPFCYITHQVKNIKCDGL